MDYIATKEEAECVKRLLSAEAGGGNGMDQVLATGLLRKLEFANLYIPGRKADPVKPDLEQEG